MELLKYVARRKTPGGWQSYGLFRCTACHKEVIRRMSAARYKSCGCAQRSLRGRTSASLEKKDLCYRVCLTCDVKFLSLSPVNRRCPQCEDRLQGNTLNEFVYKIHAGRRNIL